MFGCQWTFHSVCGFCCCCCCCFCLFVCFSVFGCVGIVLDVNVKAVEGRNVSNKSVHLINLRSNVSCFTTFYLYTLTCVVLNCLLVLFIVEFE